MPSPGVLLGALLIILHLCPSARTEPSLPVRPADPQAVCEIYAGTACLGVIGNGMVYTNQSYTQPTAEAAVAPLIAQVNGATKEGDLCRNPLVEYLCRSFFPSCENVSIGNSGSTTYALPSALCASSCSLLEAHCGPVLRAATATPVRCFPVSAYDVGTPPDLVPQCSNLLLSPNSTLISACPMQIYPEHETQALYIWAQTLGWIGFFLNLGVSILILMDPLRRNKLPGHAILCLHISLTLLSLSITVSSWVGWRNIGCANHYHLCKFQSVLESFASVAGSAWLCISAALVVAQLYVRSSAWVRTIEAWRWRWILHAFAWSYGLVFTVIKHDAYGYSVACPGCVRLETAWEPYLVMPLLAMTVVAAGFWLVVVGRLSHIAISLSQGKTTAPFEYALIRNFLFLISWLVPVAMIAGSELANRDGQMSMRKDITAWLLGQRQTPTSLTHASWWLQYGMTPVPSVLIGLVLGLHPRNLVILLQTLPKKESPRSQRRSEQPAYRAYTEESRGDGDL